MPGLRVIAGEAKGRRLKMVPGEITRPIGDRVKQALFNILGAEIVGSSFLDLFAGTGSVGIEALSRGAARAVFIDESRAAIRTIRENLEATRFQERARVLQRDSFGYLNGEAAEPFDFVFVAPPQYKGTWIRVLKALDDKTAWLSPDGQVVIQIDPKEYEPVELKRLEEIDRRRYGNTLLVFYTLPGT